MSAENANIVLIVKELGLRSTLAARLALDGAFVMTAENFRDCAVRRFDRKRTLLVLDRPAFDAEADAWVASLDAQNGWLGVLILGHQAEPPAGLDSRLAWARVDRAVDALHAILN
jgi:hypothetical protein